jgi:phospholipid-transporting ATPase
MTKQQRAALMADTRDVRVGYRNEFFPTNSISTTKYTLATFVFINLKEQFSKIANVYFLILVCLQMVKPISITNGFPSILPPLSFIVLLTAIKDAYEDYKRFKADEEENNKVAHVYDNTGQFAPKKWRDVKVGDLVRVEKNEFFPCDLVLLAASDYRKGQCFIETKNLDGETNLKAKLVSEDMKPYIRSYDDVSLTDDTGLENDRNQYQRRTAQRVHQLLQRLHFQRRGEVTSLLEELPSERLYPSKH